MGAISLLDLPRMHSRRLGEESELLTVVGANVDGSGESRLPVPAQPATKMHNDDVVMVGASLRPIPPCPLPSWRAIVEHTSARRNHGRDMVGTDADKGLDEEVRGRGGQFPGLQREGRRGP